MQLVEQAEPESGTHVRAHVRGGQLASAGNGRRVDDARAHSATVDGRRGKVEDRNVELLLPDPRSAAASQL